ncbi:metallophosphoesterase family protein [Poriferisphaera sp. WC338]|uniref:metallophosphoesterase family protein n=1 Tax=Poriferisphaera sp. WC338 TaxID=3425129 RepID=UPI003D815C36
MRLALIGDVHLYKLDLQPKQWLSRRVIGHTNLLLNRRYRFNHSLLTPLMEKIKETKPDMLVCSGDVTTTSLEDEFHDVAHHFKPLSKEVPTVIVPGNHDRYTFRSRRKKRIEALLEGLVPDSFPHYRRLTDRWHLIALDSAIPQILFSRGALGKKQYTALEMQLGGLTKDDAVVLLCHYPAACPPGVPSSWTHNLAEDRSLRKLLDDCPARILYVHGHIHQPWYWVADAERGQPNGDARGQLAYLNAGSPCLTSSKYPLGQGFWQIDLPDDPGGKVALTHFVPQSNSIYGPARMKQKLARADHTIIEDLHWHGSTVL